MAPSITSSPTASLTCRFGPWLSHSERKRRCFSIISARKSTLSRSCWAEYEIVCERSGEAPRQRLIGRAWEPCGRGCLTLTKVR